MEIIDLKENGIMKDTVRTYSGRMATMRDFHSYFDCTVEFDDGTVLPHTNYGCFWFGNIKHPDDTWPMAPEIGETAEVRGRKVSVVDMPTRTNVAFLLEDGKIVTGRSYCDITRGYFGDIRCTPQEIENECSLGDVIINKKGEQATVTKIYERNRKNPRAARYVDLTFERNGKKIVVEHKSYRTALAGTILCPTPTQQQKMEIPVDLPKTVKAKDSSCYKLESSIGGRLEVLVDNVLVKRVPYQQYLDGEIKLPKNYAEKKKRIGETSVNKRGEHMKLVVWRDTMDIDALVDGEPATHRTYQNFQLGKIVSDRQREVLDRQAAEGREHKVNRELISRMAKLGRVSANQMGQRMALWKYVDADNVSVLFESGAVAETTWYAYSHGLVVDPSEEEKAMETMKRAGSKGTCRRGHKENPAVVSRRMSEAMAKKETKDVWGRSRKPFAAYTDCSADDEQARACDISRTLDGCAASLCMYAMTMVDPAKEALNTLAKAAMTISERLRSQEAATGKVAGEVMMLAQTIRKVAEDSMGNPYLDSALENTAKILESLFRP